jgi:hypothetical protein
MKLRSFTSHTSNTVSESLKYHLRQGLSIMESVYRIESDSWLDLINESRKLWIKGEIDLDFDDVFLISTDAGDKANYKGETVLLDVPFEINEADYKGKKVKLNKPFRTPGETRKFAVYTKNEEGNVVKVRFGQPGQRIKNDDPKASKSFRARHRCTDPGPKWKPRYWSCNVHRYHKLLGLKSNNPW